MVSFNPYFRLSIRLILSLVFMCCACVLSAQAQCSGDNIADDENYRVRDVKVNALFGSAPQKLKDVLAKHRNETFSISKVTGYGREILNFFEEHPSYKADASYGVNQQNGLVIRFSLATNCIKINPPSDCEKALTDTAGKPVSKCVDVIVKIRVVPINTDNFSSNLLDFARSNQLRFYRELPRPLLALNPSFGVEQDDSYGTSVTGKVSTELLSLPSVLDGKPETVKNTQIQLSLDGRTSLQNSFYNANAGLKISRSRALKTFNQINGDIRFVADQQPQGDGILAKNTVAAETGAIIKLKSNSLERIALDAGYRYVNNRFISRSAVAERTTENVFSLRALTDGKIAGGFIRGGIWFDRASINNNRGSYRRAAAIIGFAKNIILPHKKCRIEGMDDNAVCILPEKNPSVLGVEMTAGAGKIWGNAPQYARFYGGNTTGNFLYDAVDDASLKNFPDSVLIRSFGKNQAGVRTAQVNAIRGGTSYKHFNLSLSIPVKAWSHPLIPAAALNDSGASQVVRSCADCPSIKDSLKNGVKSGKNVYIDALASRLLTPKQREDLALVRSEGLTTDEEARLTAAEKVFSAARATVTPEADAIWGEITPTINYIADTANLYSVKPLIMFDAARISAPDELQNRTRLALGGGLQFNIVVAKFEVGYLRTIRRLPNDDKGNFVVRMVFEKLF